MNEMNEWLNGWRITLPIICNNATTLVIMSEMYKKMNGNGCDRREHFMLIILIFMSYRHHICKYLVYDVNHH